MPQEPRTLSRRKRSNQAIQIAFGTLSLLLTATVGASDWSQWRGQDRDGKSSETGLLQSWPQGGPTLDWQTEGLGEGFSSVAVVGDRIYTLGDFEDGQYALSLDFEGTVRWKSRLGARHEDSYGGPRSTPTVVGSLLYVMSTEGAVVCLESASGKEVWRRSLTEDFDGYLMQAMGSYDWRFSESPLVDGDKVIVTPGHVAAMLVALDRKTGEEIWRTQGGRLGPLGSDGAAYSSPILSEAKGVRQYVQFVGRGLIGVNAENGELLWSYNHVANDIANIATPLILGDRVFASSGYGTGAGLISIAKEPDGFEAKEVYFLEADKVQNHHGGLIHHEGVVYTGTGHNKGFPIAVKLESGDILWGPERNTGSSSAAITYADGRLYFRYQNGTMILVEANPKEYREHGSFEIPNVKKPSWSHPVVSNGRLFLREQDTLLVYDIRRPDVSSD